MKDTSEWAARIVDQCNCVQEQYKVREVERLVSEIRGEAWTQGMDEAAQIIRKIQRRLWEITSREAEVCNWLINGINDIKNILKD